jgi:hypothetical protein
MQAFRVRVFHMGAVPRCSVLPERLRHGSIRRPGAAGRTARHGGVSRARATAGPRSGGADFDVTVVTKTSAHPQYG